MARCIASLSVCLSVCLTFWLHVWSNRLLVDFVFQCVVIGLQSTGEARLMEQVEDAGGELNDFVSTAKYVTQKNFQTWEIRPSLSCVEVCYIRLLQSTSQLQVDRAWQVCLERLCLRISPVELATAGREKEVYSFFELVICLTIIEMMQVLLLE